MTRQKNGTYIATIPSGETKTLSYRPLLFLAGDGIPVDAPGKTSYTYDSKRYTGWLVGSYYAVLKINKKRIKVTFDPRSLLTSDLPAIVNFSSPIAQPQNCLPPTECGFSKHEIPVSFI